MLEDRPYILATVDGGAVGRLEKHLELRVCTIIAYVVASVGAVIIGDKDYISHWARQLFNQLLNELAHALLISAPSDHRNPVDLIASATDRPYNCRVVAPLGLIRQVHSVICPGLLLERRP